MEETRCPIMGLIPYLRSRSLHPWIKRRAGKVFLIKNYYYYSCNYPKFLLFALLLRQIPTSEASKLVPVPLINTLNIRYTPWIELLVACPHILFTHKSPPVVFYLFQQQQQQTIIIVSPDSFGPR